MATNTLRSLEESNATAPAYPAAHSSGAEAPARPRSTFPRDVALAGLVTGSLDALFASVLYVGVLRVLSVVGVLQYIASGLLGASAFRGGIWAALLGAGIHFFLALAFAALYLASSRRLRVLTERPIASGLAYGAGVYFFMNFVVLPLTAVATAPVRPAELIPMLLDHMLFVGLPTALIAARGARARARRPTS
jgi:Na+/H+ antiporter NhaA